MPAVFPLSIASFHVAPADAPLMREIGLDADGVFSDPRIHVWRSLSDRENATLDHERPDGSRVRIHVKRYPATAGQTLDAEVGGHGLLDQAGVPTAPLLAHGRLADGRSFVLLHDLAGFAPADKLLERGFDFERLLAPTADLAALLHERGLHHRDLYLCHFMVRPTSDRVEVKLIDVARVARLGHVLTRRRWVVKDLAQFWYSTTKVGVSDDQRARWLARYAEQRELSAAKFASAVQRKARGIARHDERLNRKQPRRNVSIPVGPA